MGNFSQPTLPFTKMHGAGNDFIIIEAENLVSLLEERDNPQLWLELAAKLAQRLCNRNFSIGADGLVIVLDLKNPQFIKLTQQLYGDAADDCQLAWIFTNNDGSIAQTCGNATRCVTLWAYERGLIKDQANLCTAAGSISVQYYSPDKIMLNLGEPHLSSKDIPFLGLPADEKGIKTDFSIANNHFPITCVNVGNPHCVIFSAEFMQAKRPKLPLLNQESADFFPPELAKIAKQIQEDERFPESTNVEFVYVTAPNRAEVLVLERGAGATLACGSGACAALIAGVLENRLLRDSTMVLAGGSLDVSWSIDDNQVRLTGPARFSFIGELALNEVQA